MDESVQGSPGPMQRQQVAPAPTPAPARQQQQHHQVDYEVAILYVARVRERFANRPDIYQKFLDILQSFQRDSRNVDEVNRQVSILFEDHPDLISEFKEFLPDQPAAPQPTQRKVPKLPTKKANKMKRSPSPTVGISPMSVAPTPSAPHQKIQVSPMQQPSVPHHPIQTQITSPMPQTPMDPTRGGSSSKPHQNAPSHTYASKPERAERYAVAPGSSRTDRNDRTVPTTPKIPPTTPAGDQAARTPGPQAATKAPAKRFIVDKSDKQDLQLRGLQALGGQDLSVFERIRHELSERGTYDEFLKCLHLFSFDVFNRNDFLVSIGDIMSPFPELLKSLKALITPEERNAEELLEKVIEDRARLTSHGEEASRKRVGGPSYRLMPKVAGQGIASGRTALCKSVLNETVVSVPLGTEDGFTFARKNQYEEQIFKCEEGRFELDIIIQINLTTIRILESALEEIESLPQESISAYPLPDTLKIHHMRSIQRVYGNHGAEVVDMLKKHPAAAIPVVLKRLKQKDDEWRSIQRESNKLWKEEMEKNYPKSLDHQSVNFKMNDKRLLNSRSIISDIKEIKGRQDQPNKDQYVFSYPDASVMRDSFDVLNVLSETITMNEKEKSIFNKFCKNFLELFFRCPNEGNTKASSGDDTIPSDLETTAKKADAADASTNGLPQHAKPLNVMTRGGATSTSQLFYGNGTLYVLLRFHQILYERMLRAKNLAYDPKNRSMVSYFAFNAHHLTDPKDVYATFLQLLNNLSYGNIDQQRYEDECRALFGMSGYFLCTLDKLLPLIRREIQAILSCETSSKLIDLYSYERVRSGGFNHTTYLSNTYNMLGEDSCYRFELTEEFNLGIQLVENEPPKMDVGTIEERWARYIEKYMQTESTNVDPRKSRLFLLRNQQRNAQNPGIMDNLTLVNNLECKISMKTFKIFYVEESEDYMYRHGCKTKARETTRGLKEKVSLKSNQVLLAMRSTKTLS